MNYLDSFAPIDAFLSPTHGSIELERCVPAPYTDDFAGFLPWFLTFGTREHRIGRGLIEPVEWQRDLRLATLAAPERAFWRLKYWVFRQW